MIAHKSANVSLMSTGKDMPHPSPCLQQQQKIEDKMKDSV